MVTAEHRPPYAIRGALAIGDTLIDGAVIVEGEWIAEVVANPRDGDLPAEVTEAQIIAPGFIDLQVNGAFGIAVDDDPAGIEHISARLPETGVTSWLPTVISSPAVVYSKILEACSAVGVSAAAARPLGLHLEGPFLSGKRKGAHPIEAITGAPDALVETFAGSTDVRLVTLAPEREGADQRISRLRDAGIVVSLGHTDATYDELRQGIDLGATMVTHLYNAMSPMNHRAPGAVGATLTDDRVVAGLIADGVHTHPAAVAIAVRMKGPAGIALVSDAMAGAGMPPGEYPLGGRMVQCDGVKASYADGTLAGSLLTMDLAVRNLVDWEVATPAEAIQMATETPASVLRLADRGRLESGRRADLVLLDRSLRVTATSIGGRRVDDL